LGFDGAIVGFLRIFPKTDGIDAVPTELFSLLLCLLALLLVGCEAQATPIALVAEPTGELVEASPAATNPPNLLYGLFANTEGYVVDLAEIQSRALVETFYDSNRYVDYDIVAAYGVLEGWELSPIRQHLALVINPNLAPLDNEAIRAFIHCRNAGR
jgi:hypothetical protein